MKIFRYTILALFISGVGIGNCFPRDNGMKYYRSEDYEGALKEYDKILSKHPDWEEAHFGKGAALYKSNRIQEAIAEFERAISIEEPDRKSAVFYNIGNALFKSNRIQESLQFYKRALELNPNDFDAKHNYELAKLMIQQNQSPQSQDQDREKKEGEGKDQQEQQSQSKEEEREDEQVDQQQSQQQQMKQEENKDQEEAAQILNALRENEKNLLQERMKTKYSGIKKEKDW